MSTDLAKLFLTIQREERRPFLGTVISTNPLYVLPDSMEGSVGLGPLHFIRNRPVAGDRVAVVWVNDVLTAVGKGIASGITLLSRVQTFNNDETAFDPFAEVAPVLRYNDLEFTPGTGYGIVTLDTLTPALPNGNTYTNDAFVTTRLQRIYSARPLRPINTLNDVTLFEYHQDGSPGNTTHTVMGLSAFKRVGSVWTGPLSIWPLVNWDAGFGLGLESKMAPLRLADPTDGGSGLAGKRDIITLQGFGGFGVTAGDLYVMSDGWLLNIATEPDLTLNLYKRSPGGTWSIAANLDSGNINASFNFFREGDTLYGMTRQGTVPTITRITYLGAGAVSIATLADTPGRNTTTGAMIVDTTHLHVYSTSPYPHLTAYRKDTLAFEYESGNLSDAIGFNVLPTFNYNALLFALGLTVEPLSLIFSRGDHLEVLQRFAPGTFSTLYSSPVLPSTLSTQSFDPTITNISVAGLIGSKMRYAYQDLFLSTSGTWSEEEGNTP